MSNEYKAKRLFIFIIQQEDRPQLEESFGKCSSFKTSRSTYRVLVSLVGSRFSQVKIVTQADRWKTEVSVSDKSNLYKIISHIQHAQNAVCAFYSVVVSSVVLHVSRRALLVPSSAPLRD